MRLGRLHLVSSVVPVHLDESQNIMTDARLSDKELASLNAAAVTREYNVHPRLGPYAITTRPLVYCPLTTIQITGQCLRLTGNVAGTVATQLH